MYEETLVLILSSKYHEAKTFITLINPNGLPG